MAGMLPLRELFFALPIDMRRTGAKIAHKKSQLSKKRRKEQGYVLMTMLLFVALLAIGATAAIERIDMQVKRDREEEMIHRGVQYSRAIRNFVKKMGRYPTSIEDLQSTNNLRFLRKRYKDPITGKDFKLLHMGDIQSITSPGLAGATPVAAMGANGPQGQSSPQAGFAQPGATGGFGVGNSATGTPSNRNSGQQLALSGDLAGNNNAQNSGTQNSGTQNQNSDQNSGDSSSSGTWNQKGSPGEFQPGQGQTFGGGPIVGVASLSKEKTIRVFNNKNHYNEWFFIYDPTTDRGGLINTPYQPGIGGSMMPGQMGMGQTGMPGAPATTAAPNPGFGAPNSGFGNSGSSPQQPQQNPTMQNPAPF